MSWLYFSDEILAKIHESGFQVAMQKEMFLTKGQAESFYKEHEGQPYFEELITRMTRYSLIWGRNIKNLGHFYNETPK